MQTIEQLSETFGIDSEVTFDEAAPDYPMVRIENEHATARIALHGAHLTDYCPQGEDPVIFTSSTAIYREGKAIRGGIPVCWPWFGPHPDGMPSHGYARTSFWTLEKTESTPVGTILAFSLPPRDGSGLAAVLEFLIGQQLQLTLKTVNGGEVEETYSEALHTYFAVSDSHQTFIHGLDGASYIDTVGEETIRQQSGAVNFPGEVDRIYHSDSDLVVEDTVKQREIAVSKTGSHSTIVWNPGLEKGTAMDDLHNNEIHRFICAESGNARAQSITLAPGTSHTLTLTISTSS